VPIGIIAHNQAMLFYASGRRSALPGPGPNETIHKSDRERFVEIFKSNRPHDLFVGRGFLVRKDPSHRTFVFEECASAVTPDILSHYTLDQWAPGKGEGLADFIRNDDIATSSHK
jgi:hypothetical protein